MSDMFVNRSLITRPHLVFKDDFLSCCCAGWEMVNPKDIKHLSLRGQILLFHQRGFDFFASLYFVPHIYS
jgi:hypothetical protein